MAVVEWGGGGSEALTICTVSIQLLRALRYFHRNKDGFPRRRSDWRRKLITMDKENVWIVIKTVTWADEGSAASESHLCNSLTLRYRHAVLLMLIVNVRLMLSQLPTRLFGPRTIVTVKFSVDVLQSWNTLYTSLFELKFWWEITRPK